MRETRFLIQALTGKDLHEKDARLVFTSLFKGNLSANDAKSLLLLLARKGESAGEISGCLRALRALEPQVSIAVPMLIDTCGTGGDKSGSFNISTLAALVLAGAGVQVAKHGNRGLSSRCGSSDLMEALGVNIMAGKSRMITAIRTAGIGYFHAPAHHPVFSRIQPLRRSLKTRTVFNLLGPLANPVSLKAQMVGVARKEDVAIVAEVLRRSGIGRALVFHSRDGMDEISTAGMTDVAWLRSGKIRFQVIDGRPYARRKAHKSHFAGGSAQVNARVARSLLSGRGHESLADVICLNAGAGLVLCGKARDLTDGVKMAHESLACGNAKRSLNQLIEISRN